MPTSTVEDYLKVIYMEEERGGDARVAPGSIAQALGVAPGTVTSMMKTLTESGLVDYEPYSGVRLTRAGQKLARHVLRRHRLVESFLVQIMGMDWSEVHQDAEVLEHAISDRLLERMDAMLGRPAADPHGDPIPSPAGTIRAVAAESLLTCEMDAAMRVSRVTDQRTEFLQLMERHRLKPGEPLRVESRDALAETVVIRPAEGEVFRLGYRAAERVLVEPL